MSQQTQTKNICSVCGKKVISGELADENVNVSDDTLNGIQCTKCSAFICWPPQKCLKVSSGKMLFGRKKILCPVCGERLFPWKAFMIKSGNIAGKYLLIPGNQLQDERKLEELKSILCKVGPYFVDYVLNQLVDIPEYDVNKKVLTILALVRIAGIAETGPDIVDPILASEERIEEMMLKIVETKAKAKRYSLRRAALHMLICLEEKSRSGRIVPHLVHAMLNDQVDHVRAAVAGGLGRIKHDDRVVYGLIKALADNRRRSSEVAAASLADLFRSESSVAELAAESLRQIGNPRGLEALEKRE